MSPEPTPPKPAVEADPARSLPALIARERHRRRRAVLVWVGVAVVLALGIVAAVLLTRPRPVPLAQRFRTGEVTLGDLVREVRATGYVEAVSTVSVGAELSGLVASVEVDFNQHVTMGQVLARFDARTLEAQRAQSAAQALSARATVAQATSDLAQAERTWARDDDLFQQKALAAAEHEASATTLSGARARLAVAQATWAAQTAVATVARTNLEHGVIRSPIDGVVITRNIDPGQTVASVMTTPVLFTIAADLRKMEVLASVDEADIAAVVVGQGAQFTVTSWQGRTFTGTVTEVRNAARVVQDVVTYGAVIEVDNADLALKPGMTASVRVRTGLAAAALQVPNAALQLTPPGATKVDGGVWLIEDGGLVSRQVSPGLTDGERTAIGPGQLPTGATVLIDLTPEGKKAYGLTGK